MPGDNPFASPAATKSDTEEDDDRYSTVEKPRGVSRKKLSFEETPVILDSKNELIDSIKNACLTIVVDDSVFVSGGDKHKALKKLHEVWKEDRPNGRSELLKFKGLPRTVKSLITTMKNDENHEGAMKGYIADSILFFTQLLNPDHVDSDDRAIQTEFALELLDLMHSDIPATTTVAVAVPVPGPSSMDKIYGLLCRMLLQFCHEKYDIGTENWSKVVACLHFYVANKMSVFAKKRNRSQDVLKILNRFVERTVDKGEEDEHGNLTDEAQIFEDSVFELSPSLFH